MDSNAAITLLPDVNLPDTSNLFLAGLYIREELRQFKQINIQIPTKLYENVNKVDFNTYFSDPLIDQGFTDLNLKIEIKEIAAIKVTAK